MRRPIGQGKEQRSLVLTVVQWDALDTEAIRRGVSSSEVARRVLDDWLDRREGGAAMAASGSAA